MIRRATMIGIITALLLFTGKVQADDKEHASEHASEHGSVVIELGAAGEWSLQHGGSSFGPNVAIEYTAIEHWLEIEVGFTPLFAHGHAELGTDFLLKKPFELSDNLEFLIGAGPAWVHRTSDEKPTDSVAGEAIIEFVYSQWGEGKAGFFLEQSYGYDFCKHEQSLGVTAGLHIPIQ